MIDVIVLLVTLASLIFWWIFHHVTQFVWLKDFVFVKRDWLTKDTDAQHKPLPFPRKLTRKQVLSLTSSPHRTSEIAKNLASFSMSQVDAIYLNVPKKFRNQEVYSEEVLQKLQKHLPNLIIQRPEMDTGPDMKVLGSLRDIAKDAQVIVLDDDCLQKNTLVEDLDAQWDILENNSKTNSKSFVLSALPQKIFGLHLALGFASQCFRKRDIVNVDAFVDRCTSYRNAHKYCNFHDDFTVSAAFADFGFEILRARSGEPLQKDAMFEANSLHLTIPSEIKHWECSQAIWKRREQSPITNLSLYEKFLRWQAVTAEH